MLLTVVMLAAALAGSPEVWSLHSTIKLDSPRGQVLAPTGESACVTTGKLEVTARNPEICRVDMKGGEFVGLFAEDQEGVSRLVAYSLRGEADGFDGVRQTLSASLGAPTRQAASFGQSLVWMQGARQTSLRTACGEATPCLEVSKDMTARRLARSGGVFVAATPGG